MKWWRLIEKDSPHMGLYIHVLRHTHQYYIGPHMQCKHIHTHLTPIHTYHNTHTQKNDIRVFIKYIRRYSTLFVLREIQNKTTKKYYLLLTMQVTTKKQRVASNDKDLKEF